MEIIKHVAKLVNTDQRCVVAFMQIPNKDDHALVIPIDALPPRFEQAVMDVLKSAEGQQESNLAMALARRIMPDTGKDILTTLHENRMLQPIPCANVIMMPYPNHPMKLTDILALNGKSVGDMPGFTPQQAIERFNPHEHNLNSGNAEQRRSIARNLLVDAEMLESDARKKRETAYGYDPSLRPSSAPSAAGVQPADMVPPMVLNEGGQMSFDTITGDPS